MKTYKIDDIFSEKVDTGSLFVLRTKDCLYYDIFVSYDKYDNGGFSLTDYWLVSDSWLDRSLNDNPNYVNFDYKLLSYKPYEKQLNLLHMYLRYSLFLTLQSNKVLTKEELEYKLQYERDSFYWTMMPLGYMQSARKASKIDRGLLDTLLLKDKMLNRKTIEPFEREDALQYYQDILDNSKEKKPVTNSFPYKTRNHYSVKRLPMLSDTSICYLLLYDDEEYHGYGLYENIVYSCVSHKSKVKCMYLTQLIYRYREKIKLESYHLQDFIDVYRDKEVCLFN